MKYNIITAIVIVGSAFVHIAPVLGILFIATGAETTRALGAVLLTFSCSVLGYLHGKNRTFG